MEGRRGAVELEPGAKRQGQGRKHSSGRAAVKIWSELRPSQQRSRQHPRSLARQQWRRPPAGRSRLRRCAGRPQPQPAGACLPRRGRLRPPARAEPLPLEPARQPEQSCRRPAARNRKSRDGGNFPLLQPAKQPKGPILTNSSNALKQIRSR